MFCITGVFGFLQPFTTPYLSASGLSKGKIGLLTGLATACAVVFQPLLGRLSDRIDARRPIMIAAASAAAIAYLGFRYAHSFAAFLLLLAIGTNGFQYLNTVGGVLVGRLAGPNAGGAAYARYRMWGSVGYIIVGLTVATQLPARPGMTRADLAPVFAYGPWLFFGIAALALLVPDLKRIAAATALGTASPMPDADQVAIDPARATNLNRFLVAYFLYQFSLYGASAYLPLYLKSLGATPQQIPLFFAAGVISEVLVISQIGRWTDRRGRLPALKLAFYLMPLRLLCYIPANNPYWAMGVQALHGLNFGIVGAVAVIFVNDCAAEATRGAAQSRLAATAGIGLAIGPALCGWIADLYGLGAMFAAMSAVGAIGALVLTLCVRESHPELGRLPTNESAGR